jgi:hypothetical protein
MNKASISALMFAFSAIALSGCEIEKTEDGEMPDVDVDGGKLPEYDIRGPEVSVGTKEKTIEVPDVDIEMEEKQVTVPDIDVDLPDDHVDAGRE